MNQRKVIKNVTDMEIDEISVVDRGGNQFADVVIAKRADEEEAVPEDMELFDEHGDLIAAELEDGQIVFDAEGNAYQFEADAEADEVVEEEAAAQADETVEIEDEAEDRELELAKGFADPFRALAAATKAKVPQFGAKVKQAGAAATYTKPGQKLLGTPGKRAFAGGAAVGTGGTAAVAGMNRDNNGIRKSFSEEVMEELSKAMTDEDRDEVLSKALGAVEEALAEASEYAEIAKSERELRLTNEYISKAAEYNLPVDPTELGPVLYRMVETMSHEDCAVIAKCLDAASSALFDEVGYIGGGDNVDPLERVNALAAEQIGKADAGPNAFLDVMDAHPGAYDEYLAARRGY